MGRIRSGDIHRDVDTLEPTRVGIEIQRGPDQSWRDVVVRYADIKHLAPPCLAMYDGLIEQGHDEAWAALRTLDLHGCTDVIIGHMHLDLAKIHATLT